MIIEGIGSALSIEGSANAVVFGTYVEQFLAPTRRAGQVVVIDNLDAYKGERVRELIEEAGCELLYLPAGPESHGRRGLRQDQDHTGGNV